MNECIINTMNIIIKLLLKTSGGTVLSIAPIFIVVPSKGRPAIPVCNIVFRCLAMISETYIQKAIPNVIPAKSDIEVFIIISFLTRRSLIFLIFSVIICATLRGLAAALVASLNISPEC